MTPFYSIGIIGGADGPTAIFLASPSTGAFIAAGILLAAAVAGIYFIRRRKKRK